LTKSKRIAKKYLNQQSLEVLMKIIFLFSLVLASLSALSNDQFIFGEWYINGAVCEVNNRTVKCSHLNEKVSITKNQSKCPGLQINISSLIKTSKIETILNSCETKSNDIVLSSIGYGYHYYNLERLMFSGKDIHITGDDEFIEIQFYSTGLNEDTIRNKYYLSSKPLL
jgi:hypothetical protein